MAGKYLSQGDGGKTISSGPAESGTGQAGGSKGVGVSAAVSAALDVSQRTTIDPSVRDVLSGGGVNYRTGTAAAIAGMSAGKIALIAASVIAGIYFYKKGK